MLELMPILDNTKNTPLYVQLYEYIKKGIQNDIIKPGMKLPSKRKLASHLGISQNTIQTAYEQLCAEGYAESNPRKGIFVSNIKDDLFHFSTIETKLDKDKDEKKELEYLIDFNPGKIDLDCFPYSTWRKLTTQSLFLENSNILSLGEPQGETHLREEISKYLFESRGVQCSAEQIVIGAGTQFLLILLCMLIGKNYSYAIENPGFHRARYAFKDQGIHIQPISIDDDGICIEELTQSSAKVVYVTPSHQFPYGMVMPISRRMELLKWCRERDGFIIEDDYDSEFRYKGKPIPSLQGLDSIGNVIYMGTFSQALIPSIRISYLVLPLRLMNKYQEYLKVYKQTASQLHQDTLYRFMEEGHWARHLNKMRTVYRKKHTTLLSSINKYLGEKVEIIGENSGLHILLRVKNHMPEEKLIKTALSMKVKVYPTSIYYDKYEHDRFPCIMLGFGSLTKMQIEEGIKILKNAWLIY